MKHLYVLASLLALGCGGDGFSSASGCVECAGADSGGTHQRTGGSAGSLLVDATGGAGTGGVEPATGGLPAIETGGAEPGTGGATGGVETGGSPPTGGVEPATGGATGGLPPTGGVPGTGGATGGVETGGSPPTGGVETGGAPAGISCEDDTCNSGVPCCMPFGTAQGPFCASTSESVKSCGFGYTYQGLLAECTSPDDCGDQHCCVYYAPLNGGALFPERSECGSCSDGGGNSRICETDADCGPGRICRVNSDLNTTTIKTCREA